MNKKIKIIELWNIISQVEDIEKLPKKIKYFEDIYELQTGSRDYYSYNQDDYLTDRVDDKPFNSFLNDYVEILEDNTEEIEEIEIDEKGFIHTNIGAWKGRKLDVALVDKINELVRRIKYIERKINE